MAMRFWLVLVSVLWMAAAAAYSQPRLEDAGLKGPVATVETRQIALSDKLKSWFGGPKITVEHIGFASVETGPLEGTLFARLRTVYDAEGRLREDSHYFGDDSLDQQTFYRYDDRNLCSRIERIMRNAALNDTKVLEYNDRGHLRRRIELDFAETIRGRCDFVVDEQGRKLEEAWYAGGETLQKKWIFDYTEEGRVRTAVQQDPEGKPQVKQWYEYDERGRLVRESVFDGKDTLSGLWEYGYNDRNLKVEETMITGKGRVENRKVLTYDPRGNPETQTVFGRDGDLLSREAYTYEYDPQGNWTKKVTYSIAIIWERPEHLPKQVDLREIGYNSDVN